MFLHCRNRLHCRPHRAQENASKASQSPQILLLILVSVPSLWKLRNKPLLFCHSMKFPWEMSSTSGGSELSFCKIVFTDIYGGFSYMLNIYSQCPLNSKFSQERLRICFGILKYKVCFFFQHRSNSAEGGARNYKHPAWNIFRLFWFDGEKKKKEYSTAKIQNHEDNLRCLLFSRSDFIFPEKKQLKGVSFTGIFIYFCSTQMKTFDFLQRGPLAVPEYRQCVCEPRSKCFNMKNWSNILKCICNQKQTPEISPRTC